MSDEFNPLDAPTQMASETQDEIESTLQERRERLPSYIHELMTIFITVGNLQLNRPLPANIKIVANYQRGHLIEVIKRFIELRNIVIEDIAYTKFDRTAWSSVFMGLSNNSKLPNTRLEILHKAFPKIEEAKWFMDLNSALAIADSTLKQFLTFLEIAADPAGTRPLES